MHILALFLSICSVIEKSTVLTKDNQLLLIGQVTAKSKVPIRTIRST
jgi:hypothetical protein